MILVRKIPMAVDEQSRMVLYESFHVLFAVVGEQRQVCDDHRGLVRERDQIVEVPGWIREYRTFFFFF